MCLNKSSAHDAEIPFAQELEADISRGTWIIPAAGMRTAHMPRLAQWYVMHHGIITVQTN